MCPPRYRWALRRPQRSPGGAPAYVVRSDTAPVGSSNTGFAETELSVPADTPFTILFVNEDTGIPHNAQNFDGAEGSGTPVFAPADNALIPGPDEVDYEIPALAAGTYTYNCVVHATTMVGTLTVQ